MKDAIKLLLEVFSLGKAIYKNYRKVKNAKNRELIRKAIKEKNLDDLRMLTLGRKPDKPK